MQAFQIQTFRFMTQLMSAEPLVVIHRLTYPFRGRGLIRGRLLSALIVHLLGRFNKVIRVGDTLYWFLNLTHRLNDRRVVLVPIEQLFAHTMVNYWAYALRL